MKYQKIKQLGDPILFGLLNGEVMVEEKIDGSQFRIQINQDNTLEFGSKAIDYDLNVTPDDMFDIAIAKASESINQSLSNGWNHIGQVNIFAEYLRSPTHNTLSYGNVPKNHLAVFDITLDGKFVKPDEKARLAQELGFDVVPLLWRGDGKDLTKEIIELLLQKESYLGKEKIEGIVIKNYNQFYDVIRFPYYSGMYLAGKFVRAEFRESNREKWKNDKSSVDSITEGLRTKARWNKAIQSLKEQGKIENTMRDMINITRTVVADIEEEEKENIKEALWNLYWKYIRTKVVKGLPEFYKQKLLDGIINDVHTESSST